jgi:hypothetical protein
MITLLLFLFLLPTDLAGRVVGIEDGDTITCAVRRFAARIASLRICGGARRGTHMGNKLLDIRGDPSILAAFCSQNDPKQTGIIRDIDRFGHRRSP